MCNYKKKKKPRKLLLVFFVLLFVFKKSSIENSNRNQMVRHKTPQLRFLSSNKKQNLLNFISKTMRSLKDCPSTGLVTPRVARILAEGKEFSTCSIMSFSPFTLSLQSRSKDTDGPTQCLHMVWVLLQERNTPCYYASGA